MFITLCLWVIEGFEPQTRLFELTVKMGDKTLRNAAEDRGSAQALQVALRDRTAGEDTLVYMVTTPRSMKTDRVSNAIMELEPEGKGSVEWSEKSKDKLPK